MENIVFALSFTTNKYHEPHEIIGIFSTHELAEQHGKDLVDKYPHDPYGTCTEYIVFPWKINELKLPAELS